jgi:hypothetical protein
MWWWENYGSLTPEQKAKRRQAKQGNAILVRYADDFVILWNGTHEGAFKLRNDLRDFLWEELHLELSKEKTHITHLTDGLNFLGFHIQWQVGGRKPWLRVTPSRDNVRRFKAKIKALTKRGTGFATPEMRFKTLNRVIRGWGNYYRHISFTHDAHKLDFWVNKRVLIWLKNKHEGRGVRWILGRYKVREIFDGYNRWNFAAPNSRDGTPIYIARLSDIHLTRYRRKKRPNPYLHTEVVPILHEPETPLLEPRTVNVRPAKVDWLELRAQILKRDGYRCTECGTKQDTLEVHHKTARNHGGSHTPDNLQTLCQMCHERSANYGQKCLSG